MCLKSKTTKKKQSNLIIVTDSGGVSVLFQQVNIERSVYWDPPENLKDTFFDISSSYRTIKTEISLDTIEYGFNILF